MIKEIKLREAIKVAAIAVGGFLATKGMASEPFRTHTRPLAGNWLIQGQPCAIFQQGVILLVVNEAGALATAQMTGPNTFSILDGFGWDVGLDANVTNYGRTINWSNNTVWERA